MSSEVYHLRQFVHGKSNDIPGVTDKIFIQYNIDITEKSFQGKVLQKKFFSSLEERLLVISKLKEL